MRSRSFWQSLKWATRGAIHVVRAERNMRIHCAVAVLVAAMAVWLQVDTARGALLCLTIGCVLAAECVNTAIEAVVDLASPEHHELARIAKDVAAGGVLILAATAVIVGLITLGPPLWERIAG